LSLVSKNSIVKTTVCLNNTSPIGGRVDDIVAKVTLPVGWELVGSNPEINCSYDNNTNTLKCLYLLPGEVKCVELTLVALIDCPKKAIKAEIISATPNDYLDNDVDCADLDIITKCEIIDTMPPPGAGCTGYVYVSSSSVCHGDDVKIYYGVHFPTEKAWSGTITGFVNPIIVNGNENTNVELVVPWDDVVTDDFTLTFDVKSGECDYQFVESVKVHYCETTYKCTGSPLYQCYAVSGMGGDYDTITDCINQCKSPCALNNPCNTAIYNNECQECNCQNQNGIATALITNIREGFICSTGSCGYCQAGDCVPGEVDDGYGQECCPGELVMDDYGNTCCDIYVCNNGTLQCNSALCPNCFNEDPCSGFLPSPCIIGCTCDHSSGDPIAVYIYGENGDTCGDCGTCDGSGNCNDPGEVPDDYGSTCCTVLNCGDGTQACDLNDCPSCNNVNVCTGFVATECVLSCDCDDSSGDPVAVYTYAQPGDPCGDCGECNGMGTCIDPDLQLDRLGNECCDPIICENGIGLACDIASCDPCNQYNPCFQPVVIDPPPAGVVCASNTIIFSQNTTNIAISFKNIVINGIIYPPPSPIFIVLHNNRVIGSLAQIGNFIKNKLDLLSIYYNDIELKLERTVANYEAVFSLNITDILPGKVNGLNFEVHPDYMINPTIFYINSNTSNTCLSINPDVIISRQPQHALDACTISCTCDGSSGVSVPVYTHEPMNTACGVCGVCDGYGNCTDPGLQTDDYGSDCCSPVVCLDGSLSCDGVNCDLCNGWVCSTSFNADCQECVCNNGVDQINNINNGGSCGTSGCDTCLDGACEDNTILDSYGNSCCVPNADDYGNTCCAALNTCADGTSACDVNDCTTYNCSGGPGYTCDSVSGNGGMYATLSGCQTGCVDVCDGWVCSTPFNAGCQECICDNGADQINNINEGGPCENCGSCNNGVCQDDNARCNGCENCQADICIDHNPNCDANDCEECTNGVCVSICPPNFVCDGAGNCVQYYSCSGTNCILNNASGTFVNDPTCNNTCEILGCTDPTAANYNPAATQDDGSCVTFYSCSGVNCGLDNTSGTFANDPTCNNSCLVLGCTDPTAANYNPAATQDDGSCIKYYACNGTSCLLNNPSGTFPNDPTCGGNCQVTGCTDPIAYNYNPAATVDDGSCNYGYNCINGSCIIQGAGAQGMYATLGQCNANLFPCPDGSIKCTSNGCTTYNCSNGNCVSVIGVGGTFNTSAQCNASIFTCPDGTTECTSNECTTYNCNNGNCQTVPGIGGAFGTFAQCINSRVGCPDGSLKCTSNECITYNCSNGNCLPVNGIGGAFGTLPACQASIFNCPDGSNKCVDSQCITYNCSNGNCVMISGVGGTFTTLALCNASLYPCPDGSNQCASNQCITYNCSNGNCVMISGVGGTFNTLDQCNANLFTCPDGSTKCVDSQCTTYNCVNGVCSAVGGVGGVYDTIGDCNAAVTNCPDGTTKCSPGECTTYNCVNGICSPVGGLGGVYDTIGDCNAAVTNCPDGTTKCSPGECTTYNCSNGICSPVGGVGGAFNTFSQCENSRVGCPGGGLECTAAECTTYNCISGSCVPVNGTGGTYGNMGDCNAAVINCPDGTEVCSANECTTYNCSNGNCISVAGLGGAFTTLELCNAAIINCPDGSDECNTNACTTYNCSNGNCISVAGLGGAFTTLELCDASIYTCQDGTDVCNANDCTTYNCSMNACIAVAGDGGNFATFDACEASYFNCPDGTDACSANGCTTYNCVNGGCFGVQGISGTFATSTICAASRTGCPDGTTECTAAECTTYNCSNGNCVNVIGVGGTFSTLEDCNLSVVTCLDGSTECNSGSCTTYNCSNGTCSSVTGNGGTFATLDACNAAVETCLDGTMVCDLLNCVTYECSQGSCSQASGNSGSYTTLSACQNARITTTCDGGCSCIQCAADGAADCRKSCLSNGDFCACCCAYNDGRPDGCLTLPAGCEAGNCCEPACTGCQDCSSGTCVDVDANCSANDCEECSNGVCTDICPANFVCDGAGNCVQYYSCSGNTCVLDNGSGLFVNDPTCNNICSVVTGACCSGNTCTDGITAAACPGPFQTYLGDGSTCATSNCAATCVDPVSTICTGTCATTAGSCSFPGNCWGSCDGTNYGCVDDIACTCC
jgi:hypothetical protein